ncbi:MAG: replicative DNA helicase [Candidatus Bathyarchaeota archaeon]|nr:replicative DNA helicase [Candidatus Bathyarchaeota archaeon]
MPKTTRIPPQSIEAEKALLGSLMLDKEGIVKVVDFLRPDDFYKPAHSKTYQAMIDLFDKHETTDLLTLTQRLEEKKELEEVGEASYLSEILQAVPTPAHLLYYAKIVRGKKILRDLIQASEEISGLSYDESKDIDLVLDEAEKRIFSIAQRSLTQAFVPIKSELDEAFDRIDKIHSKKGTLRGVTTGFPRLDNLLAGLQESNLILLASRPALGKTALSLDIARAVATKAKLPVGIFSLEMGKEQLVDRLIAAEANVSLWKLRTGKLSEDEDFEKLQQALSSLSGAKIYIDDAASSTVLQMRAMARRLQAEKGLGLIIIDYLQLIQPRSPNENTVQQVTEISRSLKALSKELKVPVLALSQLSRAVEHRPDQRPRLSDLRESGSLEQDSDVVMFIYREDKVKPDTPRRNVADIIIAKHRNGPVGRVELYFDQEPVSFRELEKEYGEEISGEEIV